MPLGVLPCAVPLNFVLECLLCPCFLISVPEVIFSCLCLAYFCPNSLHIKFWRSFVVKVAPWCFFYLCLINIFCCCHSSVWACDRSSPALTSLIQGCQARYLQNIIVYCDVKKYDITTHTHTHTLVLLLNFLWVTFSVEQTLHVWKGTKTNVFCTEFRWETNKGPMY